MKIFIALFFSACSLPSFASYCKPVSIIHNSTTKIFGASAENFFKMLDVYEKSFSTKDKRLFSTIVHPSIPKKTEDKESVFESTVGVFGLDKATLRRSAIYEIDFGKDSEVECAVGTVKGVSGPQKQIAVLHSFVSPLSEEQVRVFSLYAPVVPSLKKMHQFPYENGLVMLHAQVWTYDKKSPQKLAEDARTWGRIDEPLAAYILAEGGRRIADANPYLRAKEIKILEDLSKEYGQKRGDAGAVKAAVAKVGLGWEFLDFVPVYQSRGIEVGLKFRTTKGEDVKGILEKCARLGREVFAIETGLKSRFRGVECLPYAPEENLTQPPALGSQFLSWKSFE